MEHWYKNLAIFVNSFPKFGDIKPQNPHFSKLKIEKIKKKLSFGKISPPNNNNNNNNNGKSMKLCAM